MFTGFGVLCSLRWWRFRKGARSVGPGLGARFHLGPAGDVPPSIAHSGVLESAEGAAPLSPPASAVHDEGVFLRLAAATIPRCCAYCTPTHKIE